MRQKQAALQPSSSEGQEGSEDPQSMAAKPGKKKQRKNKRKKNSSDEELLFLDQIIEQNEKQKARQKVVKYNS